MRYIIFLPFLFLLQLFFGCSSREDLTFPSNESLGDSLKNGPIPVGVEEYLTDGHPESGVGILGLFNVHVDTSTLKGEIIPAREVSIEDVLDTVDITNFLSLAPCIDCVKLKAVGLDSSGNLLLKIGIKHPFPAGDPMKPTTGKNRADLHIFNIEGTVVSDGIGSLIIFPGLGEIAGAFALLNADGYSKNLDPSIQSVQFTLSSIHPYVLHFDDYSEGNFSASNPTGFASVTTPGPSGNLVMSMGSDYDFKDYIFAPTGGQILDFMFVVGCTYALSAETKSKRFNPEYRVPQHCKKEASEIKVEINANNLVSGDLSSSAELDIKILDINNGVPVGTALNEMRHDSSVASISIEIPGVTESLVVFPSPTPVGGSGRDPLNPLDFKVTITNSAGAGSGFYLGLVKVLDTYPPGLNTSSTLEGKDAIARVNPTQNPLTGLYDISEFATYQVFPISVGSMVGPDCVITTNPNPPVAIQGEKIKFGGQDSTGPSPITTYEWDLDYDGTNFHADRTDPIIEAIICTPGQRIVALRVTDMNLMSSICSVQATINPDNNPIDNFGVDMNLGGDPQGVELANMGHRAIAIYKDDVYIAYRDWGRSAGPTNGSQQIWLARSGNRGDTWDAHVMVTDYPGTHSAETIYQTIWVDQKTGEIYVAYESNGPNGLGGNHDIFIRRSSDRGDTWSSDVKINSTSGVYSTVPCLTIDDGITPSRLYVSYSSFQSALNYNIRAATTTSDNFTSWGDTQVDDPSTSPGSYHNTIRVNPTDHSVIVVWGDAKLYSGSGAIKFDRSTNYGTSWGTDITVFNDPSATVGPYFTSLAINPSTGIPGVLWNYQNGYGSGTDAWHSYAKANAADGSSWGAPVQLDINHDGMARAGSLDVSADGHWVALTDLFWTINFIESFDNGTTWSSGINVADDSSIYDPNMIMDECEDVFIAWKDGRNLGSAGTTQLFFDRGG